MPSSTETSTGPTSERACAAAGARSSSCLTAAPRTSSHATSRSPARWGAPHPAPSCQESPAASALRDMHGASPAQ